MQDSSALCSTLQEEMNEKTLTVRLPKGEFDLLAKYAVAARRTKSEIVREFIRGLEQKAPSEARKKAKPAK